MKQLKPFKMFVPESATVDDQDIIELIKYYKIRDNVNYTVATLTRQEIHELIKAHAKKLGYIKPEEPNYEAECISLWNSGAITYENKSYLTASTRDKFELIQWQDFLKLTPMDVEVNSSEIPNSSTTTDRNEKAWELFLIMMGNSDVTNRFDPDEIINTAINKAAEFIKKVGNK